MSMVGRIRYLNEWSKRALTDIHKNINDVHLLYELDIITDIMRQHIHEAYYGGNS